MHWTQRTQSAAHLSHSVAIMERLLHGDHGTEVVVCAVTRNCESAWDERSQ